MGGSDASHPFFVQLAGDANTKAGSADGSSALSVLRTLCGRDVRAPSHTSPLFVLASLSRLLLHFKHDYGPARGECLEAVPDVRAPGRSTERVAYSRPFAEAQRILGPARYK